MIKTRKIKITKENEEVVEAICDFCGYKFDKTTIKCGGFGQLGFSFGFGSSFDDDYFKLEICDKCFIEKFGDKLKDQFKKKGMNADKILEDFKNNKLKGGLK